MHSVLAINCGYLFKFCTDSLTAEINHPLNLNQRRGSEMILREALRRDSSRDEGLTGLRPLQQPKGVNQHPTVACRSLSLQAAPVTTEKSGPFAKRSRSTKKREGKTQSLICFAIEEGRYLKDHMWDWSVKGAFMDQLYPLQYSFQF